MLNIVLYLEVINAAKINKDNFWREGNIQKGVSIYKPRKRGVSKRIGHLRRLYWLSGDHRFRKVDVIGDHIRISFLKYLNFAIVPLSQFRLKKSRLHLNLLINSKFNY